MNRKLQLVVADLDALLHNAGATKLWALSRAVAAVGVRWDIEDARAVLGLPSDRAVASLLRTRAHLVCFDEDVALGRRVFDNVLGAHYAKLGAVKEVVGASATLRSLRAQGLRIVVTTSLPRSMADSIMQSTIWNDEGLLDTTVTPDDVEVDRPQPDLVFEAMRRTVVVDTSRVLTLGSNPLDLAEGTIAGCGAVVGVTYGSHARHELYLRPHTRLIDHVAALLDVVALHEVAARATLSLAS